MIFRVEISEKADNDLRAIYEYIAFELRSPENASRQLDRLEKNILSLEEMPERHRRYEQEPWDSQELRMFPVDNYVVFYTVNKNDLTVTIVRVMYLDVMQNTSLMSAPDNSR